MMIMSNDHDELFYPQCDRNNYDQFNIYDNPVNL